MDTPSPADRIVPASHVPGIDPNPFEEQHTGGSAGSVIAILLIVLLLVIGAFYVWGQRLSEERAHQVIPAVGQ
ncbi:MAG: hypothetical protein JWO84_156 [Parcubacteria group bacterium]|nr:hypothetical protein [Parcubacteria group bacterium]